MHALIQIAGLYVDALRAGAGALLLSTLAFLAVAGLQAPGSPLVRRWPRAGRVLALGPVPLAMAVGVAFGWHLRWIGDDAFISFRYAENFIHGQGLVFNPGEWVEGYTNFLWTVLLAACMRLGASPAVASVVLGLASFALAIGLTSRLADRNSPVGGPAPFLLATSYTLASFGTSGLETMFTALLVLAALALLERGRPLLAGLSAVGAGMAHPDHMLFAAAMGLALLLDPQRRRQILPFAGVGAAVYLPYTAWRVHAYGDLVPNTAYAKSASAWWFDQGGLYLWTSFLGAGIWALLPLALVGLWAGRTTLLARAVLVGVPVYLLYVAKIGGDFMQGRLVVTVLFLLTLAAGRGYHALRAAGRGGVALGLGALSIFAALPVSLVPDAQFVQQITDERTFYRLRSLHPVEVESPYQRHGEELHRTFTARGLHPAVAVRCVGMVGWFSKLRVFDLYGLTSKSVARLPIKRRGRPGHEKRGTEGHVVESGVDLSIEAAVPPAYAAHTALQVERTPYFLTRYDARLVAALPAGDRPPHPVRVVTRMVANWPVKPPEQLACDLAFLDRFYLSPGGSVVETLVRTSAAALPDGVGRVLDPPTGAPTWREGFDDPSRWTITGRAFARAGEDLKVPGQGLVYGQVGPHANSFLPSGGDEPAGTLETRAFTVDGQTLWLRVAGSRDVEAARVELVVDGQVVRRATGCDSDVLTARTWDVAPFRGQEAVVRLVDAGSKRFHHLVVDELALYAE